jgi:hypothetical protein
MQLATTTKTNHQEPVLGRHVSAKVYSYVTGVREDVLGNWRWQDRKLKAQRKEPKPNRPEYRYFGESVRYWLELPLAQWEALDVWLAAQKAKAKAARVNGDAAA